VPLAIARSMLSLGMEASRAFWMARARAGLPSGSPPPSRAATVTARASLVNCWPRRASTSAFLCLIECHLEWPDIAASSLGRCAEGRISSQSMSAIANPEIFKAYDIRGVYGDDIDSEVAELIGRAFVQVIAELEGKPASELRLGLGHDMRL